MHLTAALAIAVENIAVALTVVNEIASVNSN
jgi:hypothetical protein